MKNKFLFLLPIICLALGGCSLKIDIKPNPTSESGFQGSMTNKFSYSYFSGDSLGDTSGMQKFEINMPKEMSTVDFKNVEDVTSFIEDKDGIIEQIDKIEYLAKNPFGLRVGVTNTDKCGVIKFNLTTTISKMRVYARPYRGIVESLEGTSSYVDEAAIGVNNKGFIKLNTELDTNEDVLVTECDFDLGTSAQEITIYGGPQRAVIEQIVLFK